MILSAYFSNAGVPALGLSATIRVRDLSNNSLVVTDAAMTEVGDGFYSYNFVGYVPAKEYVIRADGGATLSGADRYSIGRNSNYIADIEASAVLAKESTVALIPTTPLLSTDARLNTLAQESTVGAIPTNPLLTTDTRLNNIAKSSSIDELNIILELLRNRLVH